MRKRLLFFILTGLLGYKASVAQPNRLSGSGNQAAAQPIIPPAPTTASLGSFGNIPNDLNAGVATVTVPLAEVKGRQLTLPVSLNYRTTGLRVNEPAGWVGLGWVLNAGGCIIRTVHGLPDESVDNGAHSGYHTSAALQVMTTLFDANNQNQVSCQKSLGYATKDHALDLICEQTLIGQYDTEPDVFSYSFAGYSGTIYFTPAAAAEPEPVLVPHREWKVKRDNFEDASLNPSGTLSSFTITTEDGTQYAFEAVERTYADPNALLSKGVITAWYLTRITAPDIDEHIQIIYQTVVAQDSTSKAGTVEQVILKLPANQGGCPPFSGVYDPFDNVQSAPYPVKHSILLPARIESATSALAFYTSGHRRDIAAGDVRTPQLDSIVWLDKFTHQKRRFRLSYDYFPGPDTAERAGRRLKLLQAQEIGKPAYKFSYDETVLLPSRDSKSRDHWNFFNNEFNTTLIPMLPSSNGISYTSSPVGIGANRASSSAGTARACILNKIVYPTGGNTRFIYEPNSVARGSINYIFGEPGISADSLLYEVASVTDGEPDHDADSVWVGVNDHYQGSTTCSSCGPARSSTPRTYVGVKLIYLPDGARNVDIRTTIVRPSASLFFINDTGGYLVKMCPQSGGRDYHNLSNQVIGGWGNQVGITTITPPIFLPPLTSPKHYIPAASFVDQCPASSASNAANNNVAKHRLEPGYYILYSVLIPQNGGGSNGYVKTELTGSRTLPSPPRERTVGGMRLRQVIDEPIIGPSLTTTYNYNIPTAAGDSLTENSSGHMFFEPKYDKTTYCGSLILTAHHQSYRGYLHDGYHIGYQYVTETKEGLPNGRTLHEYYNDNVAVPDNISEYRSWPVREKHFSDAGVLVHEVVNSYENIPDPHPLIRGAQVEVADTYDGPGFGTIVKDYCFPVYGLSTARLGLTHKQERHYDITGAVAWQKETFYRYGLNAQNRHHTNVTEEWEVVAPGDTLVTKSRFPTDYSVATTTDAVAIGIHDLFDFHMWTTPVEQLRYRKGTGDFITHGQSYNYTNLKPVSIQELQTKVPLGLANYTPSSITNGQFVRDGHYTTAWVYDHYNRTGNLIQRHRPGQTFTSYVWGYDESEPIAEVQNAAVDRIAHTSFEALSLGSWDYDTTNIIATAHKTGRQAYQLGRTPSVTRDSLAASRYEVSCWFSGARPDLLVNNQPASTVTGYTDQVLPPVGPGNWQRLLMRCDVPANGTVALRISNGPPYTLIDELRLHPVEAQMTTYTYDPLVGRTSQTDASGHTTTYEYDGLGRLLRTRDEQGRILSQNEYRYARP